MTRPARISWSGMAAGLGLLSIAMALAADPPSGTVSGGSTSASPGDTQTLTPHGSLFSTLKQGFAQDPEREVVRGHFDVNGASGMQRYYCLLDPKSGKAEENGVAGQLVRRRDGMTGIKGAAVSFYRCAEAEDKGLLVTTGYLLASTVPPMVRPSPPKPEPLPVATPAPPAAKTTQADVLAAYTRFIAGQNAHDRSAVAELLVPSRDFVWSQSERSPVWGSEEALDVLASAWQGPWKLEPQSQDLRVAEVSPGVAVLIAPLLFTGPAASAVPERWNLVFVKTKAGWRIASVLTSRS